MKTSMQMRMALRAVRRMEGLANSSVGYIATEAAVEANEIIAQTADPDILAFLREAHRLIESKLEPDYESPFKLVKFPEVEQGPFVIRMFEPDGCALLAVLGHTTQFRHLARQWMDRKDALRYLQNVTWKTTADIIPASDWIDPKLELEPTITYGAAYQNGDF